MLNGNESGSRRIVEKKARVLNVETVKKSPLGYSRSYMANKTFILKMNKKNVKKQAYFKTFLNSESLHSWNASNNRKHVITKNSNEDK